LKEVVLATNHKVATKPRCSRPETRS
jgi:hypothetical protein